MGSCDCSALEISRVALATLLGFETRFYSEFRSKTTAEILPIREIPQSFVF